MIDHQNHVEIGAEDEDVLDIGWLEVCLNVRDIEKSREFYEKLGFFHVGGEIEEGWAVMENDSCRISLYQGHIERNIFNFRGGDIQAIGDGLKAKGLDLKSDVESEPDGSLGCSIEDPDGNLIYFNTHPDELEECGCEDCNCEDGECTDENCDCGHDHKHGHQVS